MLGISRTHGTALEGVAHIAQSVGDILTTPVGTRVMRRDYGSLIPDLLDRPLHAGTLLQVYAAVVLALARWEPRVRVERLYAQPDAGADGRLILGLDLLILETGERANLTVPLA